MRNAFLTILLAAALYATPMKCGDGLLCDWIQDTPTRGAFIVSHPKSIKLTEDPMNGMPHSFDSPSGYWTIVFDSFNQYFPPDSLIDLASEIDVKGYMQHIMRPPGDEHVAHTDTYLALLSGTDAVAPKTGISAYNFGVKGQHTEIQFTPPTEAPEPSTFFLMGSALILPLFRKWANAHGR